MSNTTKIIVAVAVVAVIAVGAVALGNRSDDNGGNGGTTTPGTSDNSGSSDLSDDEITATITYTNDGFSPASVTVPSGSTVRIVNESDDDIAPSSDNHPEHTINTELNFPDIAPGQSATMVVSEKGTWGMHNHFNEDEQLTVIVE